MSQIWDRFDGILVVRHGNQLGGSCSHLPTAGPGVPTLRPGSVGNSTVPKMEMGTVQSQDLGLRFPVLKYWSGAIQNA